MRWPDLWAVRLNDERDGRFDGGFDLRILLGFVCALERRASGGVLAPMLTHFVWGLIMVLALPPLFGL